MVAISFGHTRCRLCGIVLRRGDSLRAFPAFLPPSHAFGAISDGIVHQECLQSWRFHEHLERLLAVFEGCRQRAREKRPRTVEDADQATTAAMIEFDAVAFLPENNPPEAATMLADFPDESTSEG